MDIEKLIEQLRRYSEPVISYKLDSDFAASVEESAIALSTIQAENEKLRAELECTRESLDFARTKDAEIVRLGTELEQVKAERDAAIEYLREIEWCAGCKHFGGLDGCKKWAMGQCTEKHDLYEFISPQKED